MLKMDPVSTIKLKHLLLIFRLQLARARPCLGPVAVVGGEEARLQLHLLFLILCFGLHLHVARLDSDVGPAGLGSVITLRKMS
jgi:hypothetical protein